MQSTEKNRIAERVDEGRLIETTNIREEAIVDSFANLLAERNYKAIEKMLHNYDAFIEIKV